jgi:O-6-methylguanine DNA methyltransferase
LFTKPRAARSTFAARVLNAVRRIPPGRVATYGDIAALAGHPLAHRAVGNIMRECRDPGTPCHRVIAAGGALGGYGGNLQVKRELLRAEGIEVAERRVRGFADVRWTASGTRSPRSGSRKADNGSRTR